MVTNGMKFPKSIFYSVSTDASNKGNLKYYPLALRYFSKSFGSKNRVIDFYVCSEELLILFLAKYFQDLNIIK